jgi:hypothetical protein
MRSVPLILVAAAAVIGLACGSKNPPPKDGTDLVGFKGPNTNDSDKASIALPEGGAPTSSTATPSDTSSTTAATPSTTTTKPPDDDDISMVHHQIPPDEVFKTVGPAKPKVQACFKAGLKRDPSCSGEVKVKFVVKHDGTMVDAQDQGSSMGDEEVTQCIVGVIKTLKFPVQKSPGPAFGIYAINLSP